MEVVSTSNLISPETKTTTKRTTTACNLTSMQSWHEQQQHVTMVMNSSLNSLVMLNDLMRGQIGIYA